MNIPLVPFFKGRKQARTNPATFCKEEGLGFSFIPTMYAKAGSDKSGLPWGLAFGL